MNKNEGRVPGFAKYFSDSFRCGTISPIPTLTSVATVSFKVINGKEIVVGDSGHYCDSFFQSKLEVHCTVVYQLPILVRNVTSTL